MKTKRTWTRKDTDRDSSQSPVEAPMVMMTMMMAARHTNSHTHTHMHTQLNVEKFDLQEERKEEGNGRHGKKMLKYMSKASKKFFLRCCGNGNRIIKAKLKTFTHHTKSKWQEKRQEWKRGTETRSRTHMVGR